MFTMTPKASGLHMFGGRANHRGATPRGSSIPVHKLLSLDLRDPILPFKSEALQQLPLYYPLKYGFGGSSMQYLIISDDEIEIFYISHSEPDSDQVAYVKVESFPSVRYSLDRHIPNDDHIDWFTITIGGSCTLDHSADRCQNSRCPMYRAKPQVDLIASIPPVPIPGHKDIWWEFEGGYLLFYFWLCRGCQAIITSNRAT